MKNLITLPIALLVGLFAVGCSSSGGSSSGGSGVSCDETTSGSHTCATYTNLTSEQETAVDDGCTAEKGTIGTSCSTTGALGSCAVSEGGIDYSETYYSSSGLTASDAESACTSSGGKWTAAG